MNTTPPGLTERQQQIVALADRLAQTFAQRADAHDRSGTFPHENFHELFSAGYLRLAVPAAHGGEGASLFEVVLAQEHLARGDGATAMAVDMTLHLMGRLNETQQWPAPLYAEICQDILENGALINAAATEPEMGSPSRGGLPATTATPTQGGWLVSGHKRFVTMAPALRYVVVRVALPPDDVRPEGAKANAIVTADTPGLRIEDTWRDSLSLRSSGSYDVLLEEAFVPADRLVDVQPAGAPPLVSPTISMAWFTLSLAAVYLGIGQAANDTICAYAQERTPTALGKPIASLSGVQRRIGESTLALTSARTMLHQTALAWSHEPERRLTLAPQIAMAKYLCTNAATLATDQALRIAGGFGLTRELPLERYHRDARAGLTHPPHDDAALELIGRAALG